ncbi:MULTISPECIES: hemerythrin domain-containing protein [unclassified Paenibacillus]|uniref:hemerythrin domain-containing protein n=1 Tax=unclassified Paenibacillus TaxID=185978 RepID=UPI0036378340
MNEMKLKQADPTDLTFAFERLKNEHICLYETIYQLENRAKHLNKVEKPIEYVSKLEELRDQALSLIAELDKHSEWEDNELFPLLIEYFQLPGHPHTTTSLWMLEHEHELANLFFRYFLEEADSCLAQQKRASGSRLTDQLLQACRLVKEHLQTEEDTVLPLEVELYVGTDASI